MLPVNGIPIINWQISRLNQSKVIDQLIVATTSDKSDDQLCDYLDGMGIQYRRGSVDDVLSRFIHISKEQEFETIVRVTGDCPLIMPELLDSMLLDFSIHKTDLLTNTRPPTFPDGLDMEIFSKKALHKLSSFSLTKEEREHVTLGFYNQPDRFTIRNFPSSRDLSHLRWTLDYPQDFEFIEWVFSRFKGNEKYFGYHELLLELESANRHGSILGPDYRNINLKPRE
jgi:spore coat polysaccharide biosynthesis protein SpsF